VSAKTSGLDAPLLQLTVSNALKTIGATEVTEAADLLLK
jgi:hypothetical protein